jgi:uncharacterized protein YigA (DUF484 family)
LGEDQPDDRLTTMPQPQEREAPVAAADVAAFLRANPFWLAENPALYRVLAPPARVHGEHLADHMAAMLRAERAHAAAMSAQAAGVLAAGRAAAGLTARVQRAVLALLRASDALDCIGDEMPGILGVDSVTLCAEGVRPTPRLRALPQGTVGRLLRGRQVLFRSMATDGRLLHGEAAGLSDSDVLLVVPGHGPIGEPVAPRTITIVGAAPPDTDPTGPTAGPPALLALLTRDPGVLEPAQGSGALAFLGQAVAAALGR